MPNACMRGALAAALGLSLLAVGEARAQSRADDDLAVVKRAVLADARPALPEPQPAAKPAGKPADKPRAARKSPKWLKVTVVENGREGAQVKVSVPLSLARALGDELPIEIGDGRLRLCDVLRALEGGEALVEIKDEGSLVKVWVE